MGTTVWLSLQPRLGELFLKSRLGWRENDLGPQDRRAKRGENSGELAEAEGDIREAERRLDAKLARLLGPKAVKGGSSTD